MKRILAVTLALLLLVAAVPLTVAAGEAVELQLDLPVTVTVGDQEEVLFTYTAEEDATYMLESLAGEITVYMQQADENGNAMEDNGGIGFCLVTMEAGETYYFLVSVATPGEWMFPVQLTRLIDPTGMELFGGRDEITIPFLGWQELLLTLEPYNATALDLTVSVEDESVVAWAEYGDLEAVGIGQTTVTVTVDGTLTDTVTVNVVEPLPWEGTGSRPVILNRYRETQVYAFTVEEDGYYEILSEGRYDTTLQIYVEDEEGAFWTYGDSDDTYGYNFGYTDWFEAGTTYYPVVSTYSTVNGSLTFPVTVREAEAEEELPETGVGFYEDSITVALGDTFFPDGWLGTTEYAADITSTDESVVTADLWTGCLAVGLGETTLTITTESGASDTVQVTVVAPPVLTLGEKAVAVIEMGNTEKTFAFTPEADGLYVFRSFSEEDPFITVCDSEGNTVDGNDDSIGSFDFYLAMELTGGETYLVKVGSYTAETYEFLVAGAQPATSVALGLDGDYIQKDGKTYYVYTGTGLYESVAFGDALGAQEEGYEITVENESILVFEEGMGEWRAVAPGTTTMTVETESGLSDTITLVIVDYVPGDHNLNGAIDGEDLAALVAYLEDAESAGEMWYLLDVNEDGVVNEDDLELMTELAPVPFLWGDVDDDGKITSTDARLTLQYYADKIGEEDLNIDVADVDGDGEITSTDARLILQYYAGKITGFPVDEM